MPHFTPDLANPHSRGWGGDTHSSWRNSRGWLAIGVILLGILYDPKASALFGLTHYGWLWLLLWLAVALAAPAPKPVRNLMLVLPPEHRGDLGSLKSRVAALAGVEAVSFSEDGETLFVKVLQHFDEEPLQKILTGA